MKKLKNILIIILAVTMLIISFFIDKHINFLFGNLRNFNFDFILGFITNFMILVIILFFVPTLILLKNKKFNSIFYLWISFFTSVFVSFILKLMIARPRPLDINSFYGILNYSFPSMHTMVAFAALPMLDKKFQKFRIFWILFAFFVAVSRLYFNFHFLSDVVAGALIGYSIGLLLVNLEQKYNIYDKVNKK